MANGSGSTLAGRAAGFHIGSEYETDYSYDTYGRLDHVTGPGLTGNGVYYGRYASTDMVQYVSYDSTSTPLAQTQREYEGQTGGYRNVLLWVENKVGASTVSKYDYSKGDGVDSLGRRTSVVHEGSAFTADHHWSFEYNGRNELDVAERFAGDDPDDPDDQYTSNGDFIFAYDNIGNRATYRLDDEENPTAYTRNPLNQYTDTSYPTESFSYDRDGNMTADGTYAYTWDGENRLIGVAPASSPENGDKKLEFKYDYMGRRVEKIYSLHNGSTWVEQTHERFVYDQWNVIMVLNGNSDPVNQTLRKYTWGLDMSGLAGSGVAPGASPVVSGIHGAGGIGGLIAGEEMSGTHQGSYWYFYDGNGNVGQLLKYEADSPPTISTAACYEYDPYGNIIGPDDDSDGDWQDDATAYALANPFRFSTKWFDESGLGYWGYRYYSPRLGRWISRDPIEEEGGLNIYQSFGNSPIYNLDVNGMQAQPLPVGPVYPIVPEGFGCQIVEKATQCLLCCKTIVGGALVILCNPTPCGDEEIHYPPIPIPEPYPKKECDDNKKSCKKNHPLWSMCDNMSGWPYSSAGSAWTAVSKLYVTNQFVGWSGQSGTRPLTNIDICGHIDGTCEHRNVKYKTPNGNNVKLGPRYTVQCCKCCTSSDQESQKCRYKYSSGTK